MFTWFESRRHFLCVVCSIIGRVSKTYRQDWQNRPRWPRPCIKASTMVLFFPAFLNSLHYLQLEYNWWIWVFQRYCLGHCTLLIVKFKIWTPPLSGWPEWLTDSADKLAWLVLTRSLLRNWSYWWLVCNLIKSIYEKYMSSLWFKFLLCCQIWEQE